MDSKEFFAKLLQTYTEVRIVCKYIPLTVQSRLAPAPSDELY